MGAIARIGTSTAVTGLIAGFLLLVLALAGYFVYRDYQDTLARAEVKAQGAAHVASAHIRWLLEARLQTLQRLDDALTANGTLPISHSGDLRALIGGLPDDLILFVADAEGTPILATHSEYLGAKVADTDYFAALRGGAPVFFGKLINAPGGQVFTVSRALMREGKFAGAAVAVIPAKTISDFWASLDLGANSSVGLIRNDGWLIARHPIPRETMDLSRHALFTEHLPKAPAGLYYSGTSPADGVARIIGYRRLPELPLVAIGGVARDTALANYWHRLSVLALVGGPLLIALIGVSSWAAIVVAREEKTQQQLAQSLERNRLLMKDIHHRVKNNMQIVSALINLQPGPADFKAETTRRLSAMAALHQQLYQSDDMDGVALDDHIRGLVEDLKRSYGSAARVVYDLQSFHAERDIALPLTLIVSETVSNAFKHAFKNGKAGTIEIMLRADDEGSTMLRIRDDGAGFDPATAGQNLGMRLLDAFSTQIGGSYTLTGESGTTFTLRFPPVERAGARA